MNRQHILFVLLLLCCQGVIGQENNKDSSQDKEKQTMTENNQSQGEEANEKALDNGEAKNAKRNPYSRFIPTEDIEASNAVPFPIDI